MTKERARKILQEWFYQKCRVLGSSAEFPIDDEVVYSSLLEDNITVEEYTFKYLIKIAYDL